MQTFYLMEYVCLMIRDLLLLYFIDKAGYASCFVSVLFMSTSECALGHAEFFLFLGNSISKIFGCYFSRDIYFFARNLSKRVILC